MNNVPPREGARWGEDPVLPSLGPSRLAVMNETYGQANVQRALAIRENLFRDYPQNPLRDMEPEDFADLVLRSSMRAMNEAIDDGRPHSMTETLDFVEKHVGAFIVSSPDAAPNLMHPLGYFTIFYGDDEKGRAHQERVQREQIEAARLAAEAKERKLKRDSKRGMQGLAWVFGAFCAGTMSGGIWWGVFAAFAAYLLVAIVINAME